MYRPLSSSSMMTAFSHAEPWPRTYIPYFIWPLWLKPSHYNTHSFRIKAATTAASAGLLSWLIKILGRWPSVAYRKYIHLHHTTILEVPATMATCHQSHISSQNYNVWPMDLSKGHLLSHIYTLCISTHFFLLIKQYLCTQWPRPLARSVTLNFLFSITLHLDLVH